MASDESEEQQILANDRLKAGNSDNDNLNDSQSKTIMAYETNEESFKIRSVESNEDQSKESHESHPTVTDDLKIEEDYRRLYGNHRKGDDLKLESEPKDNLKVEIYPKMAIKNMSSLKSKKISSYGSFEEFLWYRQIPVWVPFSDREERFERSNTIDILKQLQIICIYDNIDVFDNLVDDRNASKNCFTVRNDCLQKVFYAGSAHNRPLGKHLAFTLRVVDQFSRHVLSVKKHYKNCCFGSQKADVFFFDGTRMAKIREKQHKSEATLEFLIVDPSDEIPLFSVKRLADCPVGHKFDIWSEDAIIGNISKIFQKRSLFAFTSGDHYIRVKVTPNLSPKDKALIVSAALLINALHLRSISRE